MRLYPVVPMSARVLKEDAVIDGYSVPFGVSM